MWSHDIQEHCEALLWLTKNGTYDSGANHSVPLDRELLILSREQIEVIDRYLQIGIYQEDDNTLYKWEWNHLQY